jgi:hypothetical protein
MECKFSSLSSDEADKEELVQASTEQRRGSMCTNLNTSWMRRSKGEKTESRSLSDGLND